MDWERLFYEPLDGASCPGVAGQAMPGRWRFYVSLDMEMLAIAATGEDRGPKAQVALVPACAAPMLAFVCVCVHTRNLPWRRVHCPVRLPWGL